MLKLKYMPIKTSNGPAYTVVGCETDMASVSLPERYRFVPVVRISRRAFAELSSLLEVVIPPSITLIEDHAFARCRNLRQVRFIGPASPELGLNVFQGCDTLERVELPDGIRLIGDAFYDCSALKELRLPDSVCSIDLGGCTSLRKIHLPSGLEIPDHDILARCRNDLVVTAADGLGENFAASLMQIEDVRVLGERLRAFASLLVRRAFTPEQEAAFLPTICRRILDVLLSDGRVLSPADGLHMSFVPEDRVGSREFLQADEKNCVQFLWLVWQLKCPLPEETMQKMRHIATAASVTYTRSDVQGQESSDLVRVDYRPCYGFQFDERM